jgi:hypothetical protein
MTVYSERTLYLIHMWLLLIGRVLAVIFLVSFMLRIIGALITGQLVIKGIPFYITIPFVLWMVSIILAFIVAMKLKCDVCGKRPTVAWRETEKVNSKLDTNAQKFIDYFYMPVLRDKKFKCVHCGSEFLLESLPRSS